MGKVCTPHDLTRTQSSGITQSGVTTVGTILGVNSCARHCGDAGTPCVQEAGMLMEQGDSVSKFCITNLYRG